MQTLPRLCVVALTCVFTIGGVGAALAGDDMGWKPARPGPEHAVLKALAGDFDATFQLRAPGAPAITSKGTAKSVLGMNGLWLVGDYHDPNYMSGEYRGHSVMGYDPAKQRYVAMWIDSADNRMQVMEGTYDEATKTLTMLSDGRDPYTGKSTKDRSITKIVDQDHHVFSLRSKSEGSPEIEIFTIDYKRK